MPHHVELTHNPYLAWGWHLIAEQLGILCNRHVQPSRCCAVFAETGEMKLLHISPEEGMPLTEVFQEGLVVHIARGFTPHDDLTDPAEKVNRSLVWSGHLLPEARLFEHFGDGFPSRGALR